jgi:hypothetical protein
MKKQVVQKEIYITEDGREFDDVEKAETHEAKLIVLKQLDKIKPSGKEYHAVYIPVMESPPNLQVFNITNPTIAKTPGWNLIEDNGNSSIIIAIEDLMKQFTTPTPRSAQFTTEEQKGVAHFKKAVADIVMRNSRLQATPEAILGNLIMELQDLIR